MTADRLRLEPCGRDEALAFIAKWHYGIGMPVHTHLVLGGFRSGELRAVSTWGWGVRPADTLRILFPSISQGDYWELGKLCVHDDEPRNTESAFLSDSAEFIRKNHPERKILYTWADGMLGKPGYVYQASGWLYGGFIWTDAYITKDGEKVHPRTFQSKTGDGKRDGMKYGKRPTPALLEEMGWRQVFGKQFRYVRFLCGNRERRRLLRESTVKWVNEYPKHGALAWRQRAGEGSRVSCEQPMFSGAVRFRNPLHFSIMSFLEVTMAHIGLAIKAARLHKGLTQQQLAERCDIHRPHLAKIESGDSPHLKLSTLERLAEALQMDASVIMRALERANKKAQDNQRIHSSDSSCTESEAVAL